MSEDEPRCRCWKPTAPHQPDCPLYRKPDPEPEAFDSIEELFAALFAEVPSTTPLDNPA